MAFSFKQIFNPKTKILLFFVLVIANFSLIKNNETEVLTSEDKRRNSIITGCTNLVYSRLNYDPYSIDETTRYMLDIFGGAEKEKKDQLISILLFNCVKNLDQESAEKFEKTDPDLINPLTPENIKILDLEKWRDLYENKKVDLLDSEYKNLALNFNRFSGRTEEDGTNILNEEEKIALEREKLKRESEENQNNIKPNTLAGLDITKIDDNLKILFAVVSISVIGFIFYYFISILGKRETCNKKNKKQR